MLIKKAVEILASESVLSNVLFQEALQCWTRKLLLLSEKHLSLIVPNSHWLDNSKTVYLKTFNTSLGIYIIFSQLGKTDFPVHQDKWHFILMTLCVKAENETLKGMQSSSIEIDWHPKSCIKWAWETLCHYLHVFSTAAISSQCLLWSVFHECN